MLKLSGETNAKHAAHLDLFRSGHPDWIMVDNSGSAGSVSLWKCDIFRCRLGCDRHTIKACGEVEEIPCQPETSNVLYLRGIGMCERWSDVSLEGACQFSV